MTNLIDRLAMRSLGILPVVRPILRPRFAPTPTLASDRTPRDDARIVALAPSSPMAPMMAARAR